MSDSPFLVFFTWGKGTCEEVVLCVEGEGLAGWLSRLFSYLVGFWKRWGGGGEREREQLKRVYVYPTRGTAQQRRGKGQSWEGGMSLGRVTVPPRQIFRAHCAATFV